MTNNVLHVVERAARRSSLRLFQTDATKTALDAIGERKILSNAHNDLFSEKLNTKYTATSLHEPTATSEDGMRTIRLRQHGQKPLPLPGVMDPLYLEARDRYKQVKRDPSRDSEPLTPFQRELRANPYAKALATDVRMCAFTRARLPTHFLTPFVLSGTRSKLHDSNPEPTQTKPSLISAAGHNTRGRINTYVLGINNLVKHITSKKGRWATLANEPMKRIYASRVGKNAGSINVAKEWGFDTNMAQIVFANLQASVFRCLTWCLKHEEITLAKEMASVQTSEQNQIACIIRLRGHEVSRHDEDKDLFEAMEHDEADAIDSSAPNNVHYDLTRLSNSEDLKAFCTVHSISDDRIVLFKHSEARIAHLTLEKLQNYVSNEAGFQAEFAP